MSCEPGENGDLCRAIKHAELLMKLKQGQINQKAFNDEIMKVKNGKGRKNRKATRKNRKNRKGTRKNRKTSRRNRH